MRCATVAMVSDASGGDLTSYGDPGLVNIAILLKKAAPPGQGKPGLDVQIETTAGKVVKGNPKTITDGPYAEAKDLVGGYTLVQAKDLGQASELSFGCPIFDVGGLVEVRPIMKMNM